MSRIRVGTAVAVVAVAGVAAVVLLRPPKPGAPTRKARKIVAALRALPSSPLDLDLDLRAALRAASAPIAPAALAPTAPARAQVTLPERATEPLQIQNAVTGMRIGIQIREVFDVAAQSADGTYVYPHAHASGGTVLHQQLDDGAEDFVSFDTRPAKPEIAYDLALGDGVSGLRLVAGSLELLDDDGAPRLRAAPPFIVGADGARTEATLAVEGCAVDTDPAPPWGRELTPPGAETCTLRVRWPDDQVVYPAVLDPRWTTTSNMISVRQDFTATMMSTGKVLAVGGRTSGTSTTGLATAEVFDPATRTWAATSSLTGARYLHAAVQLGTTSSGTTSGKVLVAGGTTGGASLNTAQLYSPSAGTWVAATNLNASRHGATATLLSGGNVLLAGGLSGTTVLNTAAVYNPSSGAGAFTATGTMPQAVKFHSATLLKVPGNATLNNKVLVVGGNSGTASVTKVQLFDGTSSWSSLTALSSAREGHAATALANGNVLLTGGRSGSTTLNTTLLFNAASGSGSFASAGNLTAARQLHTATLLPSAIVENGQVLVAGGSSGSASLSSVEIWNGTTTWTATTALPSAVQGQTATLLSNNLVLLAGGASGSTTVSTSTLFDGSFALQCTSNSQCATGFCANGVCCDTACNGGCGVCNLAGHVGTCSAASSGTVCRAQAGACDAAETCNGTSLTCPTDAVAPLGTVCRGASGACDVPETCDGATKACPADKFALATTVCRASTGTCDAAETCTGTSAACPADGFAPVGTVCRPAAGGCDAAETCTGTSAVCPADGMAAAGTVCRPAQSLCDVAETCDGSTAACPTDTFAAAGTTCGAATGGGSAPVCSGATGTCPESSGTSDVLGFESAGDWTCEPGNPCSVVGLNPSRTQGASSLEVTAQNYVRFDSAPMSSVGGIGSVVLLDITLPTSQPNPNWYGDAQMYVNSPSLGLDNVFLSDVPMTGLALGTWQTLAFQMPASAASAIAHGVYSDLTFGVVLNVPFNETGHYLLDNIRSIPDVVPSLLGIAQDGATLKAIFDYQTSASVPVTIPYGTANGLSGDSGFLASPPEAPPTTFVATTHAPFVATLSGSTLTWALDGHSATATRSSQQLPVTSNGDGTTDATLPDGRKVNIDSTPPADPGRVAGPPVGAPFNGVLTGQFAVSPSGAATYTVPISIPPGIAGMAPNLSLAYSSQGGDGIAGQGWSLGGLSMISRCPRTRQQDGYGRPVMLDSLTDPTNNQPDHQTDGLCLDGEKLFDTKPGAVLPSGGNCPSSVQMCYTPERKDFSTITLNTSGEFQVVTKAGETRSYGLQTVDRVTSNGNTAVWMLDRAVDSWGNYFDLHYNRDHGYDPSNPADNFTDSGIWISEIDYTGSLGGSQQGPILPFNKITFQYECRPDIRWTRYASLKLPQNQRLTSIGTPQGTYTLSYTPAAPEAFAPGGCFSSQPSLGLSELQSIGYCAGPDGSCKQPLTPLTFTWQGGQAGSWQRFPNNAYALPAFVGTGKGLRGTQFIDIDGDGRSDFVVARVNGKAGTGHDQRDTVLNTGAGWGSPLTIPGQQFPVDLSDDSDNPTGARFADMNGDGRADIVVDFANVTCDANGCRSCPVNQSCNGSKPYSPAVWFNTFTPGAKSGGWEFHGEFGIMPPSQNDVITQPGAINFAAEFPAAVGDVNGDGLADVVLVQVSDLACAEVDVLLNQGPSAVGQNDGTGQPTPWGLQLISSSPGAPGTHLCDPVSSPRLYTGLTGVQFQLRDVNRDGLPDLFNIGYSPQGPPTVLINTSGSTVSFAPPASAPQLLPESAFRPPSYADVDGDGFYDLVAFYSSAFALGSVPNPPGVVADVSFGNGTGWGYADQGTSPYLQVLNALSPTVVKITDPVQDQGKNPPPKTVNPILNTDDEDYGVSLADINGDGLVDLIRYHENVGPAVATQGQGGIEILYNTGTTWLDPDGITSWQAAIGPSGIPAVAPSAISDIADIGSAWVDLNGDGFVDLIQEEAGDQGFTAGAWMNPNQPPIISTFPNGLAAPTTAIYVNITSQAGAATYKDDDTTKNFTKLLTVPLLVVANATGADGSGTGALNTQTFTYHSLRQDTNGRGPLGFDKVEIQDQASNTLSVTRYAQVFPYTGLPAQVDKYQLSHDGLHQFLMSETLTTYCDGTVPHQEFECGEDFGHGQPSGSLFVFPGSIVDTTYLHPEANDALHPPLGDTTDTIVTDSEFQYDDSGNAAQTTTTTTKKEHCAVDKTVPCAMEQFSKTVVNTYTTPAEQQQGKPDSTVVTASGGTESKTHTTTFEYATADTFGGSSSSQLVLMKTHLEPDAGWPTRLDTAYAYDGFGNVAITTSCASDFDSCKATNPPTANPFGPGDPVHHPPFRTTRVSYDPSVLAVPVGYGPGRFPTRTTDPAGHSQTTIYDPILGVVLAKTDPNNIATCYTYDSLGRQMSQTDRCGSSEPLTTTTNRYLALPDANAQCSSAGCIAKVVTLTTPPSGNSVWTFTDDQGHAFETFTGAFNGTLTETRTLYDALGRAVHQSRPFTSTDQPSYIDTTFDDFNRLYTVTTPLGTIDNSAPSRSITVTTTYNGSTIETRKTIDRPEGAVTETELETKDAIGKVESETRVTETGNVTTSYAYDADGNVTVTADPANNQIVIRYDARDRKEAMTDPDMGTWTYKQDGFGDLVQQIDPNALKLDPSTTGTTMAYDPLGRMVTKTNPTEGTAQWLYDVGGGAGIGQLAAMVSAADPGFAGNCAIPSGLDLPGGNRAVKVFSYDQFGEVQQVGECADGSNFTTSYEYDALGRQSVIRYPVVNNKSQLAVGYHYTSLGFLQYLTDESTDYSVLWQAKTVNVLGQVTDEQTRNGVETVSTRNPLTGWLLGTAATAHADHGNVIQNWSYEFDEVGDLLTRNRRDAVNALTSAETFGYDLTNRLLTANVQMSNGTSSSNSYVYDALGNITQKDGAIYTYGSSGGCAAGPHAVCTVGGGTPYSYDADGNITGTGPRTVTYNASNKVTSIVSDPTPPQGNDTGTVTLMYGADANRVVQSVTSGATTTRTVYVGLGGTGKSLFEQTAQTVNGTTTYQNVNYIYAGGVHGGNAFALRVLDQGGSVTATKYYSFDHLGSVTAMSDELGRVSTSGSEATVLAYDAWGARRNPDESAAKWQSFTPPVGNREFTGQEQIPDVGLVNMNGRVYDPVLGRFLSPDPNVQDLSDTQSYNRYSYVLNNPLRYTDPTGFFWSQVKSTVESPMFWIEFAYTAGACIAAPGVGCLIAGIQVAMFNATVALGNGAGLEQTAINLGIGVGVSITGFAANLGPLASLTIGAASAAATTAITNRLTTGKWGGDDIAAAAFLSAAEGAVMMGIGAVKAKISEAGEESPGSGKSGEYYAEKLDTLLAANTSGRSSDSLGFELMYEDSDLRTAGLSPGRNLSAALPPGIHFSPLDVPLSPLSMPAAVVGEAAEGLLTRIVQWISDAVGPIEEMEVDAAAKAAQKGPLPPGWTDEWQWRYPEGEGSPRWFDPEGGEWRFHDVDPWHSTPHWDYNSWNAWNSPWQNVYPPAPPLPPPWK